MTYKEAAIALGWEQSDDGWHHPAFDTPDDPPFDTAEDVCVYEGYRIEQKGWRLSSTGGQRCQCKTGVQR